MNNSTAAHKDITPGFTYPQPKDEISIGDIGDWSLSLNFDGGDISSDAGALPLLKVEERIGLIKAVAGVIPDCRDVRYVRHTLTDLLMQRVTQIACGYEDANDCDRLRNDPVFKILAGRYPEIGDALSSQPTVSRFECSISRTTLFRFAAVFVDAFVTSYASPPPVTVPDFDDTEDRVHGNRQLNLFNGYYGNHCHMPLHVYEGLSGELITTVLWPGKRSDGKQMLSIVKRLVDSLHTQQPETLIIFRGDSHFAFPAVMNYVEATENVMYVTGLTGDSRLKKKAEDVIRRAVGIYEKHGKKAVLFHSFYYQAGTWDKPRRVIVKATVTDSGKNIRFIVTDMAAAKASVLYKQIYCARGEDELFIKDHKLYLKSDRTSCHKFAANQFRLFLHSAAYVFIHTLKTEILEETSFAKATFETIRLRLLKVGARVRVLKTRIKIELPSSFPLKNIVIRSFQIFGVLRSPG